MRINNIKIRNIKNRAPSTKVFTDRKKQAKKKLCRKAIEE